MKKNLEQDRPISLLLVFLVVLFVSCLILSNILANEMIEVFGYVLDAGTLLFPITYVLSDVFSEVYGYKWSRRVTWMAAAMNLLMVFLIFVATSIPHPEWFDASHFQLALASSYRIVLASIVSYFFGDLANDRVFRRMKLRRQDSKGFEIRAIASSFVGELVDTTLFVFIAFVGTMPYSEVFPMIAASVLIKTGYEVIILPVTLTVVKVVKKAEKMQV